MKFLKSLIFAILCVATLALAADAIYLDASQPLEKRVDDLLSRLTLEEKISLIHANTKFTVAGVERLGIPVRYLSDGPHGVRQEISLHSWAPAGHTDDYATYLPNGTALAATWNPAMALEFGTVLGNEANARGKAFILGPAINIQRTPLCGRNFEYFGEDPFLTAHIVAPYIQGVQSQDVAACVKHFAANNQELDRGSINVLLDERALREIYLPGFKAAVQQGGAYSVMGSYNQVRGEHCCHNDYLINQILKGEWGFQGLIMSDWAGTHDTRQAALNGLDLEMGTEKPYNEFYLADPFLALLKSGAIDESVLDDKVRRNLRVMFLSKTFDADRAKGKFNDPSHQKSTLKIAEDAIVLLKNETAILPLNVNAIGSIAVIGENAVREQAPGGGSSEIKALYEITPLQGLINKAADTINITYTKGFSENTDQAMIDRDVAAAKAADIAIVFTGLSHRNNSDAEGSDRLDMKLPFKQNELVAAVAAANPKTIVVNISGSPIEMPWINAVPAVVQAWFGGMEAGNAIANILFGDVNPSGKLPFTFPIKLEDNPAHAMGNYPGKDGVVKYEEGIFVGYRYYEKNDVNVLFPFGHGLSYTTFSYSDLVVEPGIDETVAVAKLTVTNTGTRQGGETIELYIADEKSSLPRPEKELKGFAKVYLEPGASQTVEIALDKMAFAFYSPKKAKWLAEKGTFDILVGASSSDIRLQSKFKLKKTL